jgi:hypothetical protein
MCGVIPGSPLASLLHDTSKIVFFKNLEKEEK